MTLPTSVQEDHDITVHKPPRVGITHGDQVCMDSTAPSVRIRGRDLREVAQRARSTREQQPGVDVLVDIEVMIAPTAPAARELMAAADPDRPAGTLRYVGTPTGLAGLINDLHALGIADGAVLQPLLASVAGLIQESTLPALNTMSANVFGSSESQSA
ncbi:MULTISPECIES: hypothetical protein [Mycolicibacterium]|jgi:alkanesulfonate monooxygenase SsuD/methylene tetrahydromethanopterin reductase-like flavin-dependent oxidoreductase (luciferase family)|uniref:hypothetical protein n=1 Tax=Mycolicibacterium TaxID=1866885 RepID=UPI001CA34010|nr:MULTISPECIES: hypothetical protein [Mycolicibacterium]MDW5611874.1 hypothetical protein [Mycolicibacterium sp. D5.8-2]QZT60830.1 hypothetical protein JN085_17510 [Mycolicibacterium austroafricanum]